MFLLYAPFSKRDVHQYTTMNAVEGIVISDSKRRDCGDFLVRNCIHALVALDWFCDGHLLAHVRKRMSCYDLS